MRQALKTAAIFGFTCALAEAGIKSTEPEQVRERQLFRAMDIASFQAIQEFGCVGAFKKRDYRNIYDHIEKFLVDTGWGHKEHHAQTRLNFALSLTESLKDEIKKNSNSLARVESLNRLLEAMMAVYERYSQKREYPLCLSTGLAAADAWNQVMES